MLETKNFRGERKRKTWASVGLSPKTKPLCKQKINTKQNHNTKGHEIIHTLYIQWLHTDLGRFLGVTSVTQQVWFTGLRTQLSNTLNSCAIKRTLLKMFKTRRVSLCSFWSRHIMPPLKKEGHIALHMSVRPSVGMSVSLNLVQLITQERFAPEASNLGR